IFSEAREQQSLSVRRPDWVYAIQLLEAFQVAAISVDDANARRGGHDGAGLTQPPTNSTEGNLLTVRRPALREQALGSAARLRQPLPAGTVRVHHIEYPGLLVGPRFLSVGCNERDPLAVRRKIRVESARPFWKQRLPSGAIEMDRIDFR